MLDTCAKLMRSFIAASERGIFCDNDRNRAVNGDSIIVPTVLENGGIVAHLATKEGEWGEGPWRSTLLFYRSKCPDVAAKQQSILDPFSDDSPTPAAFKVAAMLREFREYPDDDIDVTCTRAQPQAQEVASAMRSAVFCAIVPQPYRQATRELPAAALNGCLPVFFGPPYHSMPFSGDVRYREIAIFFNITGSGELPTSGIDGTPHPPVPEGRLEPNAGVQGEIIEVGTFLEALEYLRALPPARVKAMQTALALERFKLSMRPPPGTKNGAQWAAGEIVVRRMCEYATKMNAILAARDAERAASNKTADLPKLSADILKAG